MFLILTSGPYLAKSCFCGLGIGTRMFRNDVQVAFLESCDTRSRARYQCPCLLIDSFWNNRFASNFSGAKSANVIHGIVGFLGYTIRNAQAHHFQKGKGVSERKLGFAPAFSSTDVPSKGDGHEVSSSKTKVCLRMSISGYGP